MSAEIWGWEHCSHEGIGMPGCRTCDPIKPSVAARYEWIIERFKSRLAVAESLLSQIAYHPHSGDPIAADDRAYSTGVQDGHRCAAALARLWFEPKRGLR